MRNQLKCLVSAKLLSATPEQAANDANYIVLYDHLCVVEAKPNAPETEPETITTSTATLVFSGIGSKTESRIAPLNPI